MNAASRSIPVFAFLLAAACSTRDADRQRALDDLPARHLIGQWNATLLLERPLTLSHPSSPMPSNVSGSITLLEDHYGRITYPQMASPTHAGVYDLDLHALGLPDRGTTDAPVAVARTTRLTGTAAPDSVNIVLNPGGSRYALLLRGRIMGDSIVGTWQAESFLDGGGSFVLHRRNPR